MHVVYVPFNTPSRCVIGEKGYAPGFYACECRMVPIDDDRRLELGLFDDFDISGGKRILSAFWAEMRARFVGLGRAMRPAPALDVVT